jgi:hypothetical protein
MSRRPWIDTSAGQGLRELRGPSGVRLPDRQTRRDGEARPPLHDLGLVLGRVLHPLPRWRGEALVQSYGAVIGGGEGLDGVAGAVGLCCCARGEELGRGRSREAEPEDTKGGKEGVSRSSRGDKGAGEAIGAIGVNKKVSGIYYYYLSYAVYPYGYSI